MLDALAEAGRNLLLHKTRSILAALGIVFGVASVICMLSISEVARRDVIGRIERMGVQNVLIDSKKPERIRRQERQRSDESWVARYGITRADLDILRESLPEVEAVVPMRVMLAEVHAGAEAADVHVVGTTPEYDEVMEHRVRDGRFLTAVDGARAHAVCVLGRDAARTLFPLADPLQQVLELDGVPFTVVGVLERKGRTGSTGTSLSNPDNTAFIPFASSFARFGRLQMRSGQGSSEATEVEVSRAVLRVHRGHSLTAVAGIARRFLENRHSQSDVEVTVPHALLGEQRKAERIFRWVMGSLAAISLLVGGVGIMNIMLANMAERRHEIGLRRALGATQGDVLRLFVGESTLLCFLGGAVGVGLGVVLAGAVGSLASWTVVHQPLSFPLGVAVAVLTGLVFGTVPAVRAARMDPVSALRVE